MSWKAYTEKREAASERESRIYTTASWRFRRGPNEKSSGYGNEREIELQTTGGSWNSAGKTQRETSCSSWGRPGLQPPWCLARLGVSQGASSSTSTERRLYFLPTASDGQFVHRSVHWTGSVAICGSSVNKEYLSQIQFYSMFSELPVLSNTVVIITVCVKQILRF